MLEVQTLETQRLLLKGVTPEIIHQLFQKCSKTEMISFFGTDESGYQRYQLMHEKGMTTYNQSLYFFVLFDKVSQQAIGECGFHTWNFTHRRAELFYNIHEQANRGKGLMKEALAKIINFGFKELQLHRIQALIAECNTASLRLLLHYNFTKEGVLREDYWVNQLHEDSVCYSLLASEWKKNNCL